MSSVLIKSVAGTTFVSLETNTFQNMHIANTGSVTANFNLLLADAVIVGTTSRGTAAGAYYLKAVEIPVNTTLTLDALQAQMVNTTGDPDAKSLSNIRFIASTESASETVDIIIEL